MDIYLLPRRKGKYRLYSTEFKPEPQRSRTGLQEDSEEPKTHRFWNLIKSGYQAAAAKRDRNEKLLKEMAILSEITVHYPANLSQAKAREIYDNLVRSKIKKHRRWLIVDGALLPIGVIFTLVPGPNLLLAYLAWRTLAHCKSKKGGEKAVADLKISFVKEPHLRELFETVHKRFVFGRAARIKAIGEEIGIADLERLI
jgi:hypothetical protein